MSVLSYIVKKYVSIKSWKTNEKIVIIESDDWGTERTRDKAALKNLLAISPMVENDKYTKLDSIATVDDLSLMFDVLTSVRDSQGSYPKITANVCMANPDFEKIYASGYSNFFYEPFYETIKRRPQGDEILSLWKTGIEQKIFKPQLHGREHVHALAWLEELRNGNFFLIEAFKNNSWGIPYKSITKQRRKNLMSALDTYGYDGEDLFQDKWITDAVDLFSSYFGFKSKTFIAPCYKWHSNLLDNFKKVGIEGIQGISIQYEPLSGEGEKYKSRLHINGSTEKNGIVRIARNTFFEPALDPDKDWVDLCLYKIQQAFNNRLPAIIGSHRINYIGSLNSRNRDENLKRLKTILHEIVSRFPEVVFLSSDELVERIKQ